MSGSVELNRRAIRVDGQDIRFYSGELVPCRTPPERWAAALGTMKAAGLTTVTFFIPWNWHETAEGEFDFTGRTHPQRNLAGFLDCVAESGLHAVARPGPFITGEWRHGGIPEWFLSAHPEALARDGQDLPHNLSTKYPAVSYLHPAYVTAARRWFEAVLPLLAKTQRSQGGPLIEVYLDDEPAYFQHLKFDPLSVDYNGVVAGGAGQPGFYQEWLRARYGADLAALNDAHGSMWRSFEEASPPRERPAGSAELPRFIDWYHCKLAVIDEHLATLYTWARELGIDVPLAVLFPYFGQHYASDRMPRELARRGMPIHVATEGYPAGLFGVDLIAEDQVGHIAGNTKAYLLWWAEGVGPPVSIETQSAMAAHLSPAGLEMYYTLQLGHGLNGINFFMMVGGDTPRGFELDLGRTYDVSAPIGAGGDLRPHYWLIRRLGDWLARHHLLLASTSPVSAIAYAIYPPYEAVGFGIDTLAAGFDDDLRDAQLSYFGFELPARGTLPTLLALAGLDFDILNLSTAGPDEMDGHRQIWTAGLDFMDHPTQQRLVDYVERGGHLVLLPRVPRRDHLMRPANGPLARLFPYAPIDPQRGTKAGRLTPVHAIDLPAAGIDRAPVTDYLDTFALPESATACAFDAATGRPCGYTVEHGAGRATLLGFKLRYSWEPKADLKRVVNTIADLAPVVRPAWAEGWELTATLRLGDAAALLFVTNPSDVPQCAKIHWHDAAGVERAFPQLIDGVTFPRRGGLILHAEWDVPDSEACLAYCTSQVQDWSADDGVLRLRLHAHAGVTGEAAFGVPRQPVLVAVDGQPPQEQRWESESGRLTVVYRHSGEAAMLDVHF